MNSVTPGGSEITATPLSWIEFGFHICRVRELEKARFGKMERALYRNRSPLMRPEGAAVRFVSGCTDREKRKYTEACMWKATVLRGLFFSKVVQSSYLLNSWGKEFWRWARGWTGGELGIIILMSIFFFG